MAAKRTTGIVQRHGTNCRGGRCKCPWRATVSLGEGKTEKTTHKTFDAARSWQTRRKAEVERGVLRHTPAGSPTLRQQAEAFLAGIEDGTILDRGSEPYRPATVRSYERALRVRALPALGDRKLNKITRAELQKFVDSLYTGAWKGPDGKPSGKPLGASTVANTMDPVRVLFRRAIEDDLVAVNPTRDVRMRKTKKRIPRIAEPEHRDALLAALPEIEDRALWGCAIYAGLRRGELRELRWSDVDLPGREVHVSREADDVKGAQAPKGETGAHTGERTVPIFDSLAELLIELKRATKRDGADLVFGRTAELPFISSTVRARALRAWKAAGVAPITLHEGRHTFTSVAMGNGVDITRVSKWLGHADVTITLGTYTHLLTSGEQAAREAMNAALSPQAPTLRLVG